MSSILKVDTIQDQAGNNIINESGNVITIGASGDTITVPAGATVSGFTSAGIDDNATSTAITISSDEDVTFTEDILLGDNKKAKFGTGNDLEIYHTGTQSVISDVGSGNLNLEGDAKIVLRSSGGSENYAQFFKDGAVELYYDNAKKFETTSAGATITGTTSTSGGFFNTVNNSLLTFGGGNAGNVGSNLTMYGGADGSTGDFRFRNSTTINAFITAAGQIQGISGAVSAPTFSFTDDTDTGISRPTTNALNFVTAGAERARLDASGNLLIATTSTDSGTAGIRLNATGFGAFTRDGGQVLTTVRLSSDGEIIRLKKDTATVGRIFSMSGANIQIGSGDVGLRFYDTGDAIYPVNNGTNLDRDNAIDLGRSGVRFKDIYLSGGAYLGGTGTANKLEDYEEGTWTPSASVGSVSHIAGGYIKIGRLVTLTIDLSNFSESSSTANIQINGIPFAVDSSENMASGAMFGERIDTNNNGNSVQAVLTTSSSGILFFNGVGSSNFAQLRYADINDGGDCAIRGTITYLASS